MLTRQTIQEVHSLAKVYASTPVSPSTKLHPSAAAIAFASCWAPMPYLAECWESFAKSEPWKDHVTQIERATQAAYDIVHHGVRESDKKEQVRFLIKVLTVRQFYSHYPIRMGHDESLQLSVVFGLSTPEQVLSDSHRSSVSILVGKIVMAIESVIRRK